MKNGVCLLPCEYNLLESLAEGEGERIWLLKSRSGCKSPARPKPPEALSPGKGEGTAASSGAADRAALCLSCLKSRVES